MPQLWYDGKIMDEEQIIGTATNLSFIPSEDLMELYVRSGRFTPEDAHLLICAAEVYLKLKGDDEATAATG